MGVGVYYFYMNCPVCGADMRMYLSDVTENPGNGDKYDRTIWNCGRDDSWVTTETPHAGAPQVLVKQSSSVHEDIDADDVDDE